jgi:hypothetical protein
MSRNATAIIEIEIISKKAGVEFISTPYSVVNLRCCNQLSFLGTLLRSCLITRSMLAIVTLLKQEKEERKTIPMRILAGENDEPWTSLLAQEISSGNEHPAITITQASPY